jgi:hypothetical protein
VSDTFTPLISPNLAPFAFAPIKRLVRPGLGFESMRTARPIIAGSRFVSELGFDSLDVGGLSQGRKFEVDSRVFGAKLNLATLKAALL